MGRFFGELVVDAVLWLTTITAVVMHLADQSGILVSAVTVVAVLWVAANVGVIIVDIATVIRGYFSRDVEVMRDSIGREFCVRYPALFILPWVFSIICEIILGKIVPRAFVRSG